MAALLALTVHAHIEFQFYLMGNLIIAGVLMAALYVLTADDRSFINISLEKRDRLIWSGTLVVTGLLVALTILSSAAGVHFLNRANAGLARGNVDDFANNIALSRQYAPRSFADADVQLAGFYIDLLAQPPMQMTADDRRKAYDDTMALLDHAAAANPAWGDVDHKRAKLYLRGGADYNPDYITLADQSWQQALRKNPLHFHAREEYAGLLLKQGKVEDAYNVIQDGLHRPMSPSARVIFTGMSQKLAPLVAAKHEFEQKK
jgi:tetratricopeptide (TPR) repeat protein